MADAQSFDVVVLGAGPAGLAAAIALRQRGVEKVVVLEREGDAGGATRHCGHPPFGLREFGRVLTGPAYARRLARAAREHGMLSVATPDGRKDFLGRRVVLVLGARESSRSARLLTGDRPVGVLNTGALQAQITLHRLKPFARPVIVGTELVGLSAIWTCLSHGIRPQMVVEANQEPVVRWPLNLFPTLVGIPLRTRTAVTDIRGGARIEAVEVTDASGLSQIVPCDGLLLTGQFLPEAGLLRGSPVRVDAGTGGPIVDQFGRCTDPAYFAAGNLLRPVENAGWCHAEGEATGRIVADDLNGGLAPSSAQVAIKAGQGVRFVVPQHYNVSAEAPAMDHLQLRLVESRHGTLCLRRNGSIIWSKVLHGRIERRFLIPLRTLTGSGSNDDVEVRFS